MKKKKYSSDDLTIDEKNYALLEPAKLGVREDPNEVSVNQTNDLLDYIDKIVLQLYQDIDKAATLYDGESYKDSFLYKYSIIKKGKNYYLENKKKAKGLRIQEERLRYEISFTKILAIFMATYSYKLLDIIINDYKEIEVHKLLFGFIGIFMCVYTVKLCYEKYIVLSNSLKPIENQREEIEKEVKIVEQFEHSAKKDFIKDYNELVDKLYLINCIINGKKSTTEFNITDLPNELLCNIFKYVVSDSKVKVGNYSSLFAECKSPSFSIIFKSSDIDKLVPQKKFRNLVISSMVKKLENEYYQQDFATK